MNDDKALSYYIQLIETEKKEFLELEKNANQAKGLENQSKKHLIDLNCFTNTYLKYHENILIGKFSL